MANVLNQKEVSSFASYIGVTTEHLIDAVDSDLISEGGLFTHNTENRLYAKNVGGIFEVGASNAYSKDEVNNKFATISDVSSTYIPTDTAISTFTSKFITSEAPITATAGDIWVNTDDNTVNVAIMLSDDLEWVEV